MHEVPWASNLLVDVFALLVFIVCQLLFWWFVGSNKVKGGILKKASVLKTTRQVFLGSGVRSGPCAQQNLPVGVVALDAAVHRVGYPAQADARTRPVKITGGMTLDAEKRRRHNFDRTVQWMAPVIGTLLGLLFFLGPLSRPGGCRSGTTPGMTLQGMPHPSSVAGLCRQHIGWDSCLFF